MLVKTLKNAFALMPSCMPHTNTHTRTETHNWAEACDRLVLFLKIAACM